MAFVIDLVVIAAVFVLVHATLGQVLLRLTRGETFTQVFLYAFLPLAALVAYPALAEYLFEGRTLGKAAMRMRTVRVDGGAPTLETFATRAVFLFVDFAMTLGTLGLLAALASPYRQRLGDRIAQTVVVRANPRTNYQLDDILAIKTVDDHVVVYPAAARLKAGQALAIKELIVRSDRHPSPRVDAIVADAAERVSALLDIYPTRGRAVEFLRQVLRDYIVLTR